LGLGCFFFFFFFNNIKVIGFIRVAGEGGEGGSDDIRLQKGHDGTGGMAAYTSFTSNPATNDWVPNVDEDQVLLLMVVIRISQWKIQDLTHNRLIDNCLLS
jgi:hypothetical protein